MLRRSLRSLKDARRKYELTWRYLYSFTLVLRYKLDPHSLTGEAARVLVDLKRNGMAITTASALLGSNSLYDELAAALQSELTNEITKA